MMPRGDLETSEEHGGDCIWIKEQYESQVALSTHRLHVNVPVMLRGSHLVLKRGTGSSQRSRCTARSESKAHAVSLFKTSWRQSKVLYPVG